MGSSLPDTVHTEPFEVQMCRLVQQQKIIMYMQCQTAMNHFVFKKTKAGQCDGSAFVCIIIQGTLSENKVQKLYI